MDVCVNCGSQWVHSFPASVYCSCDDFQGLFFHVTPSVAPSPSTLKIIIENAGGQMVSKRPPCKHMATARNIQVLCHSLPPLETCLWWFHFYWSFPPRLSSSLKTLRSSWDFHFHGNIGKKGKLQENKAMRMKILALRLPVLLLLNWLNCSGHAE